MKLPEHLHEVWARLQWWYKLSPYLVLHGWNQDKTSDEKRCSSGMGCHTTTAYNVTGLEQYKETPSTAGKGLINIRNLGNGLELACNWGYSTYEPPLQAVVPVQYRECQYGLLHLAEVLGIEIRLSICDFLLVWHKIKSKTLLATDQNFKTAVWTRRQGRQGDK